MNRIKDQLVHSEGQYGTVWHVEDVRNVPDRILVADTKGVERVCHLVGRVYTTANDDGMIINAGNGIASGHFTVTAVGASQWESIQ